MKIAITGGSGFIGQRLTALLKDAGHDCVNIDIRDLENPIDILDIPALTNALKGCDAVYALAAEHRDDVTPRSRYYDVNVKGTRNICDACDANGIKRLIFTSSFAVYGLNTGMPDERAQPAPFNDYGQSKLEGEDVLQKWAAKTEDTRLTIVRPVVVFGEDNRGNVYTLVNQIASGKFMMVGSGRNKKSMAYVGNVAAFLQFILKDAGNGEIYNYADGPDYSMNQLVDVICTKLGFAKPRAIPYAVGLTAGMTFDVIARMTGRKFPISAVRVEKFCADTTSDASKAMRTGFVPPYTLEEGFARFIAHDFNSAKKAA
ncbi:MAG TPA: NAD-dependent epimerase/dehydratase family protein [Micavibrio sp.]|nr:NAD-dependent epimerase/dehydratase family protein [Micavibrio sp.]